MSRRAHVFPTDRSWFDFLSSTGPHQDVNFWTPNPWGGRFAILSPGDLLLFRLKAPLNLIAGGGVFSHYAEYTIGTAWEVFGPGNGAADAGTMRQRIGKLRRKAGMTDSEDYVIGCIVLTNPFFWPPERWFSVPSDYSPHAVRGRGYDLTVGTGRALWSQLVESYAADRVGDGIVLRERPMNPLPGGFGDPIPRRPRLGQSAFRSILMDGYGRRCAITRTRVLPALEAAHIQPYGVVTVHEVRNGLLLRSDIHRLFDTGYLTISAEYVVQVSSRLLSEWGGDEEYSALHGRKIGLPQDPSLWPDRELLHWHSTEKFLG